MELRKLTRGWEASVDYRMYLQNVRCEATYFNIPESCHHTTTNSYSLNEVDPSPTVNHGLTMRMSDGWKDGKS